MAVKAIQGLYKNPEENPILQITKLNAILNQTFFFQRNKNG